MHAHEQRATNLLLAAVVVGAAVVSYDRASRQAFDFHHFYLDARYVYEHGALNPNFDGPEPGRRRQLPFYLPTVPVLLAPLTAGGPRVAAACWALLQAGSLAVALWTLRRWAGRPAALAIGVVLALPALHEAAKFNQLTFPVLALVVVGADQLARGGVLRAGGLLAVAAVLKLLPALLLVWLLVQRRLRAAAAFVGVATGLIVVPPLVALGPAASGREHVTWWDYNVRGASARGLVDPALREHFIDHRNQSIPAVVARLCWREHPYRAAWHPAELQLGACTWIARAVALGLLGLLVLATHAGRSARPTAPPGVDLSAHVFAWASVYLLAMLILAPLLRQYYLAWALPALVLLATHGLQGRGAAGRTAAWVAVAAWVLGMAAWLSDAARLFGAHLLMLIVMAATLVIVALSRRVRRGEAAVDERHDRPPARLRGV
ncbi:MAG: glycosyltransferase 87 family protein [Phycisphaerae bacterium]